MQLMTMAHDSLSTSLPTRDKLPIVAALVGVTLLAWIYLFRLVGSMGDVGTAEMMQLQPWTVSDFMLMFFMWAVMMVGMMVPSATPTTLIYAAVARKAERQGTPVAATGTFVAGYLVMWSLFSIGATLAQWGLERGALLSPMMVSASPFLGAGLLVAAGTYQLTPMKSACLRHCRSPAHFIAQQWRTGILGAFRMGMHHGLFCLGCCWLLMGLLFVGGVMNLAWIAIIAVFVLLEKLGPAGPLGGRVAGGAMIATGIITLFVGR